MLITARHEPRKTLFAFTLAFSLLVLLSSCSSAAPAPTATMAPAATMTYTPFPTHDPGYERVTFSTADGLELGGTFYPARGGVAVVFTHMGFATQGSWRDFAERIRERGFPALTFDFRGYGRSYNDGVLLNADWPTRHSAYAVDARAAIQWVRGQGYTRILCIGADMGGTACINAALTEEIEGFVVVGSEYVSGEGAPVYPDDLVIPDAQKLFITTELDEERYVQSIQMLYDQSPEPRDLVVLPGSAHGTGILFTSQEDAFIESLLSFLRPFE